MLEIFSANLTSSSSLEWVDPEMVVTLVPYLWTLTKIQLSYLSLDLKVEILQKLFKCENRCNILYYKEIDIFEDVIIGNRLFHFHKIYRNTKRYE